MLREIVDRLLNLTTLEILQAIGFAATLVGGNIFLFQKEDLYIQLIVSVILIGLYLWALLAGKQSKEHTFKENSKDFVRFFRDWYSRQGALKIFCSDLRWLEGDNCKEVVSCLMHKAREKKLKLYLRDTDAASLFGAGK